MKRPLFTAVLAIVSFASGALIQRYLDQRRPASEPAAAPTSKATEVSIDFANQPLWAYGFETVLKAGEHASPQAAPSRKLRANEDPDEQTRIRNVPGSNAAYRCSTSGTAQMWLTGFPPIIRCRCRRLLLTVPPAWVSANAAAVRVTCRTDRGALKTHRLPRCLRPISSVRFTIFEVVCEEPRIRESRTRSR